MVESVDLGVAVPLVAGSARANSPKIEPGTFESSRDSLREEITSEIKGLLMETEREFLRTVGPKTKPNENEENEQDIESKSRNFDTLTTSVTISSTQNNAKDVSRKRPYH